MILDAIKAASPQARIAGALISLAIWLAPAFAVWLYMHGKASAQYDLGKADAVATCATANANALKDAIDEAAGTQKDVFEQARKDADAIARTLDKAERQATKTTKEIQAYAKANPLSADCVADSPRVRMYNDARRGQAAAD